MTLSDDTSGELSFEDVSESKQKQLGEQIQEIVNSQDYPKDIPFDSGW